MDTYREQLQEERKDIKARFIKLVEFINSAEFYRLSDNHQQILRNQKVVMEEYLDILNLRTYENMILYEGDVVLPNWAVTHNPSKVTLEWLIWCMGHKIQTTLCLRRNKV